jgi:Immunity protein 21
MNDSLKWVESAGGPLVLVQGASLVYWRGATWTGSDYRRACAVSEELAVISVHDTDALVLGDEPHRTAYCSKGERSFLVRWVAASTEDAVQDAVQGLSKDDFGKPEVNMLVEDELLVLMDSSLPGPDAGSSADRFRLALGRYQVSTAVVRKSDLHLVIHQFGKLAS